MQCNVKIIGTAAGVVAAKSGISHWATEDIAFMRVLPNLVVLSVADSLEAYKVAQASAQYQGPMYIRLSGGTNCPQVYKEDYDFVLGKAVELKTGTDVAILATGLMVSEALEAANILEEQGISCTVINFHTIKPLDKEKLDSIFEQYKLIVSVEEHNILGGLGSAIAEYKATKNKTPRQVFIGFPDSFAEAGSQQYIWKQKGLLGEQIAERICKEVN
jgi:transketolase